MHLANHLARGSLNQPVRDLLNHLARPSVGMQGAQDLGSQRQVQEEQEEQEGVAFSRRWRVEEDVEVVAMLGKARQIHHPSQWLGNEKFYNN